MDPKALSHLDPKQREAYARVMGTAAEIHGDPSMDTPADASEPSIISNEDPLAQNVPSTPFDTTVGGLSSSPSIDTTAASTATDLTTPAGMPDPTPSIFTNSAADPDPTQATIDAPLSDHMTTDTPPTASSPTSSFFTSSPVPDTASTMSTPAPENADAMPDLASSQGFPPVQQEQEPTEQTITSDNLAPVAPASPFTSEQPGVEPVMPQPFNTQPLPSPAEVNQATNHEASPLLRVLYIVGAVVFFAIYTIFWIKVFNLPFIF
jgi:hypothetical protein